MSDAEGALEFQLRATKQPKPERELQFHPTRRWRFDFAWPDLMVACEVEGGVWVPPGKEDQRAGRHLRGKGFEEDCVKYLEASILGWTVVRVSSQMAEDGRALELLTRLLAARL